MPVKRPKLTTLATGVTATAGLLVAIAAFYQAFSTSKQVEVLHQQTMVSHFTASAEMLGSDVIAVRIAGIQALAHLAHIQPEAFHLRAMRLLCAFIREPVEAAAKPRKLRADVQTALDAVIYRSEDGLAIEAQYRRRYTDRRRGELKPLKPAIIDLRGSNLQWARLYRADLGHSILDGANLSYASGNGANFSGASLVGTTAHKAIFISANFDFANMLGSDLSYSVLQNSSFIETRMPNRLVAAHLEGSAFTSSAFGAVNLKDARLENADLSGARFATSTRVSTDNQSGKSISTEVYPVVSQKAMDAAIADPNDPPILPTGMQDTATGQPLVWKIEERGAAWKERRALLDESRKQIDRR